MIYDLSVFNNNFIWYYLFCTTYFYIYVGAELSTMSTLLTSVYSLYTYSACINSAVNLRSLSPCECEWWDVIHPGLLIWRMEADI